MAEDVSEKAEIMWGKYVAEIKYKNSTFKSIIVANVVPMKDFFKTLRGLFMHAKVALEKKQDEQVLLNEVEPKLVMFTVSNPTISIANRENRFIYFDRQNFLAYSLPEKSFKKVANKELLEKEITDVYSLAPPRGEFVIDLNEMKITKKRFLNKKEGSRDEEAGAKSQMRIVRQNPQ